MILAVLLCSYMAYGQSTYSFTFDTNTNSVYSPIRNLGTLNQGETLTVKIHVPGCTGSNPSNFGSLFIVEDLSSNPVACTSTNYVVHTVEMVCPILISQQYRLRFNEATNTAPGSITLTHFNVATERYTSYPFGNTAGISFT